LIDQPGGQIQILLDDTGASSERYIPADAERVLLALVGAGDVPVQ
jgi:hypothetical protein